MKSLAGCTEKDKGWDMHAAILVGWLLCRRSYCMYKLIQCACTWVDILHRLIFCNFYLTMKKVKINFPQLHTSNSITACGAYFADIIYCTCTFSHMTFSQSNMVIILFVSNGTISTVLPTLLCNGWLLYTYIYSIYNKAVSLAQRWTIQWTTSAHLKLNSLVAYVCLYAMYTLYYQCKADGLVAK